MTSPTLEVADILRAHGDAFQHSYGHTLCAAQHRVLHDLVRCRTAALGGHIEECDRCGHQRVAYNSCRNRHCPKCQGADRAAWLQDRLADVLDTEYHHVVFTLPHCLAPLALQNPRLIYGLLLRLSAATLLQVAADPTHLGAEVGLVSVLHTWGQTLCLHPHVHCVVTGGGLSAEQDRWIGCRQGFFLPVRVLSRLFRGKFLSQLKRAYHQGQLHFHGHLQAWSQPSVFSQVLEECWSQEWVVYSKAPFGGPEQVLKYLARYTHRVAISNPRLLSMQEDQVRFAYKAYAHGHQVKEMTLAAVEFLRRFLQHVLPSGFMRIRHYGLLANRHRAQKIPRCRQLLREQTPEPPSAEEAPSVADVKQWLQAWLRCPCCVHGQMQPRQRILPQESATAPCVLTEVPEANQELDSS